MSIKRELQKERRQEQKADRKERMRELHSPSPRKPEKRVPVQIKQSLHDRLSLYSIQSGLPHTVIVERALSEWLARVEEGVVIGRMLAENDEFMAGRM